MTHCKASSYEEVLNYGKEVIFLVSLTDQLKMITKHQLGDGAILTVFNLLQLLTSTQFLLVIYRKC